MRAFLLATILAQTCLAQTPVATLRTGVAPQPSVSLGTPFLPAPVPDIEIKWDIPPSQWHAESLRQAGSRVELGMRDLVANERMASYKTPSTEATSQAKNRLAAMRAAQAQAAGEAKKDSRPVQPEVAKLPDVLKDTGTPETIDRPFGPDYLSPDILIGAARVLPKIPGLVATAASLRCTSVQLHPAHHSFPLLGRMCHLQLNCYFKGVKGSGFQVRVPVPESLCPTP